MATAKELRQISIVGVAESLGMRLKPRGSNYYTWEEHDSFTIDVRKNVFYWFSEGKSGDPLALVQVVQKELTGQVVSYKAAKRYLETGDFSNVEVQQYTYKPFSNYLSSYETNDKSGLIAYLRDERALSEETIHLFDGKGVLAQATYKTGEYVEPVILFKSLDAAGKMIGGSLQGIVENKELYDRGRLKRSMKHSDGTVGLNVDIGTPKRLIVAESPIDLMSYYELHKNELEDVRLVAMDGLKEGVVSRHYLELYYLKHGKSYEADRRKTPQALAKLAKTSKHFQKEENQSIITLAVDNDPAGRKFLSQLENKGIRFIADLPPLKDGEKKSDWNDILKQTKERNNTMEINEPTAAYQTGRTELDSAQEVDHKLKSPKSIELFELNSEGEYIDVIGLLNPNSFQNSSEIMRHIQENYPDRIIMVSHDELEEMSFVSRYGQIEGRVNQKAPEQVLEQEKNAEGTIGDFPDKQEAAPLPEANQSQPLNDLSPNQTQPQPLLYFTTKEGGKSIDKRYYHLASPKEVTKLNRYAPIIQQTAKWYLDTLADSQIIYLYQDEKSISSLAVQFDRDKFMHLTGVFPYREGQTAEQTLLDFANGKGEFDSILMANKGAAFDKLKVLPELEAIIESDAFYFGDLSQVPKLHQLDLDKAIKSGDEDVLLALRTVDGTPFPASLMKLRGPLSIQLKQSNEERTILGVYRYRNNQLEQLSLNTEYVKDGGSSFKTILNQVVEDLNQGMSSDKTVGEEVYYDKPSIPKQLEKETSEKEDSQSTIPGNNKKKLDELLASKDRAGLSQHLKEGIHQYLDSKQYKDFLDTMSRFPHYSYRNVMLLKAQKPDVSAVTSFKSWKENFSRSVKKGEKALRIFAPMTVKLKDPETGKILKDEKGNDRTKTIFKLVPVFDVSQTEGKELPKAVYQLEGTHENYSKLYRSAKEYATAKGLRFEFDTNLKEANGYYSYKEQKIVIKSGMSEQQTLKTIYHEIAHADLHSSENVRQKLKYSHAELQAESVAYIVSHHYGLDTADYSFGYLASWVEDKEALSDLEAQLEIVQKEAQQLIQSLDAELEKQLGQSLEQTQEKQTPAEKLSFEERLARAEKQSQLLEEKQKQEDNPSKKQPNKESNQER